MSQVPAKASALSALTPAEKRKETLARQKMAEIAKLREQEANGKGKFCSLFVLM